MTYVNSSREGTAGLVKRAGTIFSSLRLSLKRRRVFKQTIRELQALSNRELADLGIDRSMITRVSSEAAYGK
ncbi:MAG: DUF1127 domain-containing protein [Rhodobacteraceae bacterium]|nr:DUF1127 domain-containing protein [Paracoccaceae bacterium]